MLSQNMPTDGEKGLVCGRRIQTDPSGQGHAWRNCSEIHPDITEEIAAEIIDGKQEECGCYTASNGCKYRWGLPK